MPKQEEIAQELDKLQQRVSEEKKDTEKVEHGTRKILRMVLMYGALALIIAIVVIAFINRH